MTFEEVQHEYDVTVADIQDALRFVGGLAEQESFHMLPTAWRGMRVLLESRSRAVISGHRSATRTATAIRSTGSCGRVRTGDIIFSFFDTRIAAPGIGRESPKPE